MPRPAPKKKVETVREKTELDAATGKAMSIREFVVREQAGLWQVWHDGRLVSDQRSQFEGLCIAEGLAHAAAGRGERARLFVGEFDSHPIEFLAIEPRLRAAPEQGIEKAPPERG
jgi:hypothetical protein